MLIYFHVTTRTSVVLSSSSKHVVNNCCSMCDLRMNNREKHGTFWRKNCFCPDLPDREGQSVSAFTNTKPLEPHAKNRFISTHPSMRSFSSGGTKPEPEATTYIKKQEKPGPESAPNRSPSQQHIPKHKDPPAKPLGGLYSIILSSSQSPQGAAGEELCWTEEVTAGAACSRAERLQRNGQDDFGCHRRRRLLHRNTVRKNTTASKIHFISFWEYYRLTFHRIRSFKLSDYGFSKSTCQVVKVGFFFSNWF